MYDKEKGAGKNQRLKIGHKDINLAGFFDQGSVTKTFRMDTDNKTDNVYLTVSLMVCTPEDYEKFENSSTNLVTSPSKYTSGSVYTNVDEDDSSDDYDTGGK